MNQFDRLDHTFASYLFFNLSSHRLRLDLTTMTDAEQNNYWVILSNPSTVKTSRYAVRHRTELSLTILRPYIGFSRTSPIFPLCLHFYDKDDAIEVLQKLQDLAATLSLQTLSDHDIANKLYNFKKFPELGYKAWYAIAWGGKPGIYIDWYV